MESFNSQRPKRAKAGWALVVVSLSTAGALTGLLAGSAMAASVNSDTKRFTVKNDTYVNKSFISNAPHYSDAEIYTLDGSHKGVGHIGAKTRVYWDNGALCEADVWRYNTSATSLFQDGLDNNCGGYIYGHGNTAAWNGTDYGKTPTYKTPNIYG